jgi:hypothetical protein
MILERAGGRVEAGTAPQGGARFTVVLPRAEFPTSASKPRTGGQAL